MMNRDSEQEGSSATSPEPTELMARARAGQPEALGALCELYRNYLRALARSGLGPKLRERVELSDVVQEALIDVVRTFPRFTGRTEADLVAWLRRLVSSKLADLGRYHMRDKRGAGEAVVPLEAPVHPADGRDGSLRVIDAVALSQPSPSEAASRRELIVLLADALAGLPDDEAEVIWLYHVEGFSFETIGARLGRNRKSIRVLWARGLKALRRTLDGPPGGALHFENGRVALRTTGGGPRNRDGHGSARFCLTPPDWWSTPDDGR